MTVNRINPDKLLLSKWTAVKPSQRERHFLVIRLYYGENDRVETCDLEAVLTRISYRLSWQDLKDETRWRPGWK